MKRHVECTNLREWKGPPVKIDPLAHVKTLERFMVARGYGSTTNQDQEERSSESESDDNDLSALTNMLQQRNVSHNALVKVWLEKCKKMVCKNFVIF